MNYTQNEKIEQVTDTTLITENGRLMIHKKKIVCNNCKTEYEIPLSANFMYFCPECKDYNGCECEYGFAAIVPCEIYVGEKLLGRLTGGADNYHLDSGELDIHVKLTEKYKDLAVYHEACDIILEKLKEEESMARKIIRM